MRNHYRISPCICFKVDRRRYIFALIPTITIVPLIYIQPNCIGIVDVWWLCFHIYFGKIERKGEGNAAD